jgi:hypothetical protein
MITRSPTANRGQAKSPVALAVRRRVDDDVRRRLVRRNEPDAVHLLTVAVDDVLAAARKTLAKRMADGLANEVAGVADIKVPC